MTCQTMKCNLKTKAFLGFTQGRLLIKGQDDVCSVSFLRIGGKSYNTAAGVVGKCVP